MASGVGASHLYIEPLQGGGAPVGEFSFNLSYCTSKEDVLKQGVRWRELPRDNVDSLALCGRRDRLLGHVPSTVAMVDMSPLQKGTLERFIRRDRRREN